MLIEAKANIDAVMEDGLTPLMFATYNGRAEVVQVLLQYGANTEIESHDHTALDIEGWEDGRKAGNEKCKELIRSHLAKSGVHT